MGFDMALAEYKSTSKFGRSKLRFNHLHASDPMRLSVHERLRERRFAEGKKMLDLMLLDLKLDPLSAEFAIDLDGLTKAGGDVAAYYDLTENRRGAIAYACRNATRAIRGSGVEGLTGFKIIEDLQLRAQLLLADPVRLIRLQCAHKWWH